ncbi:MAG: cupin domain-containing protein [Candidatus Eremiobacteraeota bacterium]|nr:cupin domain-containing protein [Candidatus Eremiobacteraeota bacterium]
MWKSSTSENVVARLLQPHTVDEFASEYYERKPLYIARDDPSYYTDYFSLAALEEVLYGGEIPAQSVNIFRDGIPARVESFTRKSMRINSNKALKTDAEVIDPDRVSALFAHGCSVVLDRVQTYSPSVRNLCRGIEWFFGHKVSTNLYLTPAGNQGFAAHYDTHDTLLLQVEGSKHWKIYGAGFDLPIDDDPRFFHNKKTTKKGEALFEIEFRPGDLLYLPRGFMHEGTANEKLSMHLTIGLYPAKWSDILGQTLADGIFEEAVLRAAIATNDPPDFSSPEISQALARVFSPDKLSRSASLLAQRFTTERSNNLAGQMRQLARLGELCEESTVAIRDHMLYEVEVTEAGTKVSFSGKGIVLGSEAAPIIRDLEQSASVRVGSLMRHGDKALDVVRRLIQEGFLVQATFTHRGDS